MRIVLDAMGTDNHPQVDVAGGVLAAQELNETVILIGNQKCIEGELKKYNTSGLDIEVVHAEQTILNTDKPSVVGRSKPQSSMHIGMNMIKAGHADAFVTMGNTGAALSIATLHTLRRIRGVKRPALGATVRVGNNVVMLLDIGANTDARPEWLAQFAVMGNIYVNKMLDLKDPRIALLSNGEEDNKGNQLVLEASELIAKLNLNYIGNVEPKEVLEGCADVVVADGFVGNIAVKTFEASLMTLSNLIRSELKANPLSIIGGLFAKPAFSRLREQFEIGGALLLGINGVVIIGHGRGDAVAVKRAIEQARRAVTSNIVKTIQEDLTTTS